MKQLVNALRGGSVPIFHHHLHLPLLHLPHLHLPHRLRRLQRAHTRSGTKPAEPLVLQLVPSQALLDVPTNVCKVAFALLGLS